MKYSYDIVWSLKLSSLGQRSASRFTTITKFALYYYLHGRDFKMKRIFGQGLGVQKAKFSKLSHPSAVTAAYDLPTGCSQVTKLFGHVRMIPSYSEAMLMDPAPPAYIIDCPSPFDVNETPQTMTIFRTCSPNYVPGNLVRYVESGPCAYPPTYEEALRCPLFELSVDDRGNSNVRAAGTGRTSSAITFETSL